MLIIRVNILLLIPASFLGGGIFCLACDLIARTAFAPTEVSISSVTAVFGAPVADQRSVARPSIWQRPGELCPNSPPICVRAGLAPAERIPRPERLATVGDLAQFLIDEPE